MDLHRACACFLAAALSQAAAASPGPLLDETFKDSALAGWKVDSSGDNTVNVREGVLRIRAAENTYAHIERPLDRDHVRVGCELKAGSGISWATSLFLYWRPGDWCQIGVIPRSDGRYYACITTGGQREEHDLARCRFSDWQKVGIELGTDCIRFLADAEGKGFRTELFKPRSAELMGPPALLIVGKGFGLDANSPTLNSDYAERGAMAESSVRRVLVEPTPADRMHVTDAERRARELILSDPIGRQILDLPGDPTFDAVAERLPALKAPREAVGVPEHRYEVGIAHDGTIELVDDKSNLWERRIPTAWLEVGDPGTRFGTNGCQKRLLDGFVPVVLADWKHDGLEYSEAVLGWSEGMSPDAPQWAYVRLAIHNPGPAARAVPVRMHFRPESDSYRSISSEAAVPAGDRREICFRLPAPMDGRPAKTVDSVEFEKRLAESRAAWSALLESGLQIRAPEPRVNDAWRAWLAYNYLDVDKQGERFEPHDGAGFYEEVYGYSAALYCHALDLYGHHAASRRYIRSMLTLCRPDGLFFINYGLPDHGSLIMAMCEHYRLTGDREWLSEMVPQLAKMGDWIVNARAKALASEDARNPVTRGLIKFVPYADYQNPTFSYYGDVYSCLALQELASVLPDVDRGQDAARFRDLARAYLEDIRASMQAAAFEYEGRRLLPMEPDTRRHLKNNKYRTGGYYGLVASMLLEAELLPADDPLSLLVARGIENGGGLIAGTSEFNEGVDHAYTYGYWINCLRRDDIERVLLGFYTSLACCMGRETYGGVEGHDIMQGVPTPTMPHLYSGTQQLRLLRMMLVQEEHGGIVIGRGVPRHWHGPGQSVSVRNAPTPWGVMSYTMSSGDRDYQVKVHVEPPSRRPAEFIRVVVRHPSRRPIAEARVNGTLLDNSSADAITITAPSGPQDIEVRF